MEPKLIRLPISDEFMITYQYQSNFLVKKNNEIEVLKISNIKRKPDLLNDSEREVNYGGIRVLIGDNPPGETGSYVITDGLGNYLREIFHMDDEVAGKSFYMLIFKAIHQIESELSVMYKYNPENEKIIKYKIDHSCEKLNLIQILDDKPLIHKHGEFFDATTKEKVKIILSNGDELRRPLEGCEIRNGKVLAGWPHGPMFDIKTLEVI